MSATSHLAHLQTKHATLESSLAEEMARPSPDFYTVRDIKKQKLLVKEEITALIQSTASDRHVS